MRVTQPFGGSVTVSQISDATANGRSLISAPNYAAMQTLLSQGLTLISTTAVSASSAQTISSIFSATYRTYLLVFDVTGSADLDLKLQLTISGTATAGTGYYTMGQKIDHTNTVTALGAAGTASWTIGRVCSNGALFQILLTAPFAAVNKQLVCDHSGSDSSFVYQFRLAGLLVNSSSHDGIKLTTSTGNVTGTVKVYGLP